LAANFWFGTLDGSFLPNAVVVRVIPVAAFVGRVGVAGMRRLFGRPRTGRCPPGVVI